MTQQLNTVTAVPVWAFTPVTGHSNTCILFNNGLNTAYFGGSAVTQNSGQPILPNQKIVITQCTSPVYVCSGFATTSTTAVTSAAYTAGTTTMIMSSTALTAGINGTVTTVAQVGTGTSSECVNLTMSSASTTVTTTALNYDHRSAATVTLVTSNIAQVTAYAGAQ